MYVINNTTVCLIKGVCKHTHACTQQMYAHNAYVLLVHTKHYTHTHTHTDLNQEHLEV